MKARTLLLAQGLPVRVEVEQDAWLEHAELAEVREEPVAILRVRSGAVRPRGPEPAFALGTHWVELAWEEDRGHFEVRGGEGALDLYLAERVQVQAELSVQTGDVADTAFAISSTLRLLLSLLLASRGGFLVHCSSVMLDGQAVLFLGASGAGKTTTARRLGREGALRLADDTAVLWVHDEIRLEPCRFDRAARLEGRDASWPVRRAYVLRKGAERTCVGGAAPKVLSTWLGALFSPRLRPALAEALLDRIAALARSLPPRIFAAAPSGELLPALRNDLGVGIRPSGAP